ncbi:DUF2283 domain-containing protein [Thermoflexus hugenholtzii]|uniref:DUF2283 domain-containing protein n=1 Tax=Thermoflexus hugenholtzii TaxID=1495650 RepID=UPI0026EF19FF|nr:DUF2283 domain-containing protein [Thermoflexus hugenholtzii]
MSDRKTDALTLIFSDSPVAESAEIRSRMIGDCDVSGDLVSPEILDALQWIPWSDGMEHQVLPPGLGEGSDRLSVSTGIPGERLGLL